MAPQSEVEKYSVPMQLGNKEMNKAEKCMKWTITSWKPEHEKAIEHIQNAKERYKEAGEKGKEKLAWACSKLSEVHYDNGSRNLAAKASEEAARVYESMKESHRAIECLQKAAEYFQENGQHDEAGKRIKKAARLVGDGDVDLVIQLFSDACSYIEADLEARLVSEALFFDAVSFAAKQMRYDDSVKFMDRLLTLYLKDNNKATFSNRSRSLCMYIIIILLRKPDLKQAVAKFSALCMECGAFVTSKEADISQGLINIFKNANQDALKQFLTDHKHDWIGIQNEIDRQLRKLDCTGIEWEEPVHELLGAAEEEDKQTASDDPDFIDADNLA